MTKIYSAGTVTAYGSAVQGGYEGSYEDFCELQADLLTAKESAEDSATTASNKATEASNKATEASNKATEAGNKVTEATTQANLARSYAEQFVGAPRVAETVSAMTDTSKIYVYTGSENGYTSGNWYYHNGSAWTSGGVYNSTAFTTDKTLSIENAAADAAACGELKSDLSVLDDAINDTTGIFHYDDFSVGALVKSNSVLSFDSTDTRMVSTPKSIVFQEQITITPKNGYRMYIYWTDGRNYSTSNTGWTTNSVTVPKGQYFMVTLRQVASDTGYQATVKFMVGQFAVSPSPLKIVENKALARKTMYVSTGGSDSTGVGTLSNPYATFSKAIAMGAEVIQARAGTYKETIAIDGGSIKISAYWESFVSGSVTDRPKVIIDGDSSASTALTIENCSEVVLEDVAVKNCTGDGVLINRCDLITLQNCEFNNNGTNGIVINYSNGVIRDCKANNNGNDGFNMNYFGDTQFYNCSGHDNGDDGISHHQGCTGCINGGEWYNNVKGGVASPAHGSQVDILNIYSHDNGYGIYANADSDTVARTFHVWNSVLVNNTQYGITSKRNTCYVYNCKISGNTVGQTTAPSGGHIYTL